MNKNLQIIKLYNKEYSIRRIAKELKIDRNRISKILKINNKITFNNKNSYELKFGGNFKVLKILKEIY